MMQKALNVWIKNQMQKKVPLRGSVIREKALRIYKRFPQGIWEKRRFGLKNDKLAGKAASADHVVRSTTCRSSRNWGFRPQHVFKADEIILEEDAIPYLPVQSRC